ncbi:hypothetical protein [Haladaptatus sp. T7]|uniref:hypothetical protein n=1 Tax=Haladaptatus sp. T7 TaxID=2029368 RepID=UPI0021A250F4|nr:hypothetical protein [Haladaptatus sp. T7]GKZ15372.1 hypothetical protein HAL_32530 [Haladaptatus sp. T7]
MRTEAANINLGSASGGDEDPADGIHGELAVEGGELELVSDVERTDPDRATKLLGCDTHVARTRAESVRYPNSFRED